MNRIQYEGNRRRKLQKKISPIESFLASFNNDILYAIVQSTFVEIVLMSAK